MNAGYATELFAGTVLPKYDLQSRLHIVKPGIYRVKVHHNTDTVVI
jgi:hypothetical protein